MAILAYIPVVHCSVTATADSYLDVSLCQGSKASFVLLCRETWALLLTYSVTSNAQTLASSGAIRLSINYSMGVFKTYEASRAARLLWFCYLFVSCSTKDLGTLTDGFPSRTSKEQPGFLVFSRQPGNQNCFVFCAYPSPTFPCQIWPVYSAWIIWTFLLGLDLYISTFLAQF